MSAVACAGRYYFNQPTATEGTIMKKYFVAGRVNAIADRTDAKDSTKLLASISPNLPPPPAGMKFSVESIDALLKGKPVSERMQIKSELRLAGLLA
jgi:hypothetical protein